MALNAATLANAQTGNLPHFMKSIAIKSEYTDDTPVLNDKSRHLVFVYGNHMTGYPLRSRMESAALIGTGFTQARNLSVLYAPTYVLRVGGFRDYFEPVALRNYGMNKVLNSANARIGAVQGQVFSVTTPILVSLDRRFRNNKQWRRGYEKIKLLPQNTSMKALDDAIFVDAWMYIGNMDFHEKLIRNRDYRPVAMNRSKKVPGFEYSYYRQEYLNQAKAANPQSSMIETPKL